MHILQGNTLKTHSTLPEYSHVYLRLKVLTGPLCVGKENSNEICLNNCVLHIKFVSNLTLFPLRSSKKTLLSEYHKTGRLLHQLQFLVVFTHDLRI